MKKIAIYIPSIEGGGVEKNLFYISAYLVKKNIDVSIITANKNKKKLFNKKINFISPKSNRWNKSSRIVKTFICLGLLIGKLSLKKTLIFSFQSNISAIIASKILRTKIIIRLNTSPDKYINNHIKKIFFKTFYSMSNKIIVNSLEFKKNLNEILQIKSSHVFNPVKKIKNNERLKISFFSNFKGLKIMSIGRLTDQKDQITILKSLSILKDKKINFRFFLIGTGYKMKELNAYIKNYNLTNYIKLVGYKPDAFNYIKSSDLFILSSKFEGLPNVLIEAQFQGVPIISSNCRTGPKEILLNGKLGSLFKVGDYISLSKNIISYKKNKKIYLKKAKLASRYLYRFDYKKNLDNYYNIINRML